MTLPPELSKNSHFVRYHQTWERNPASVVFIPLADLYREQGFYEEATQVCQKGLEFHPQSIGGRLMLARIYFDQEKMEEARRETTVVLSQIPGHREAKALDDRIARATGVVSAPKEGVGTPDLFETCTMAEIYAAQGETETALSIVKKILESEPGHQRATALEAKLCGSSSSTVQT